MKKLLVLVILWVPFSLGSFASVLVSLWAVVFEHQTYGKNVLRAMDKTLAAVLGFSGYFTLSAEAGASTSKPWTWLCRVLDVIQPGHCAGAARKEGLL